jgi:hypothetical protein
MFKFFLIYIENTFGFKIEDNNENYKEFCQVVDKDGSLAVDLEELSAVFD